LISALEHSIDVTGGQRIALAYPPSAKARASQCAPATTSVADQIADLRLAHSFELNTLRRRIEAGPRLYLKPQLLGDCRRNWRDNLRDIMQTGEDNRISLVEQTQHQYQHLLSQAIYPAEQSAPTLTTN